MLNTETLNVLARIDINILYNNYSLISTQYNISITFIIDKVINCYPAMQEIIVLLQQIKYRNSEYIQ